MFARHGIQNALRTRRRSVAFLLLMTLLVTLLGTSLGLSFALQKTLRQCRENYSTIGLVEYLGPGYPSATRVVEDAGEILAEFESKLDRSDPALVDWEPTRMALGYTPALEMLDRSLLSDRFVAVIKIRGLATVHMPAEEAHAEFVPPDSIVEVPAHPAYDRVLPTYDAMITKILYSGKNLSDGAPVLLEIPGEPQIIPEEDYVPPADSIWIPGHYYLVHGSYAKTSIRGAAYMQLSLGSYELPGVGTGVTDVVDITQPDGSCAKLDGSTDIEAVAETYQITTHALTVRATDRPADLLPFQQDELTLVQGDYYAAGSKGCLISQALADDLGLGVGDELPLSLAVREDTLIPYSYWAGDGFDVGSDTYTVSGIFSANEDYESTVYIPVREDLDMTVNHCSYTLGQMQIQNGQAQEYVERLQEQLPGSIRITVYDQGYTAVSQSLEDMLRMVQIIAGVCLAVGLGFLVLFGYLLVYRQRGIGRTMIRVGAARRNVHTYFLFCAGTTALPAAVLGLVLSRLVCLGVLRLLELLLNDSTSMDLFFSNTALAMQRTATEYLAAPGWGTLALIALAALILALVSCLVFSAAGLERRHKRRRVRHTAQGARSRSLKGGALTYARLSARRGGFRSLVPVLAGICAAVLFCQLTGTVTRYDEQLMKLRADSSVRGNMTDISGRYTTGLVLDQAVVNQIAELPGVTDLTWMTATSYYLSEVYRDGVKISGPGLPEQPTTTYEEERYMANLAAGPELILINRLEGAPEFMYSTSLETQWLEGYDSSVFAEENGALEANICAVPTDLMDQYDIRLGDTILLEVLCSSDYGQYRNLVYFQVVCSYVQEGRSNNIYTTLRGAQYGGVQLERAVSGATFSIPDCTDLAAVKQALYDMGLSAVGKLRPIRNFVIINDAAYLTTERAAAQRLWYMQHLFPVVYAIALGLAYLLAFLQVQSRRRELRTMRSVGADRKTAYASLFWEQLMLALLGVLLGAGLCLALGWGTGLGLGLTAAFAALWLLGAHVALSRANSRHILKNRREVE